MTTPRQLRPVELGAGIRVLKVQMVHGTGEVDDYDLSRGAMTVLTGPRNSSKTTTLKVIDYCFGNSSSLSEALGSAIDEKYVSFSLDLSLNGRRTRITRDFTSGRRGRILVDGDTDLAVPEFSDWLLRRLGWPRLSIPLGRNKSTASQLIPLSFRSTLRHIYRREDSWTEFAYKEQEYLRRAVVSLLLGFAPARYETAEYDLGQAQRRLAATEAVYRDVLASTDEAVRAVVNQLGLPPIADSDAIHVVRAGLQQKADAALAEKEALTEAATRATRDTASPRATPGVDPELPNKLERAATDAAVAAESASALQIVVTEHQRSRSLVQADIYRLHRLVDAVDAFDELPVRICPACEQSVDAARAHEAKCYLCDQEVTEDRRRRRAEREQRALAAELDDLASALERAVADLDRARAAEKRANDQRVSLARRLQDARAARLAPFITGLEDIATEIGRIEQQLAALPALETILNRRVVAEQAMTDARAEVDRLSALSVNETRNSSDASDRCAKLAERMNDFLVDFEGRGWVEGKVTISADELTFYVGTRPWDQQLGAEARVLFFLAYSYGLLHLDFDLEGRACPPGLLMLDNPYQQGLASDVVVDGITRIGSAAETRGTQVILTQARSAQAIAAAHAEIVMAHEYAT
ncbi:hypothetical protein [Pseudofrankia sp. BMG5.36]|uniref:hypothetical protein n=1 Tax=Pseudofrankia sp. BMG5.36 TaxID=1834512 RepID=UPI001042059E|nr:hypothetical protein [Pseudofrankia sp. BMG5.36]